ncbi:cell division protein FtsQ/DivIB [Feifania hominis]|uniref:FtsQ-type POTRA domain-containing protein n=1 Tax=Feifania hominis TaxID=2763660 RepID=A0A926HTS4_9FIRM|nr:FtsQ-type POTRA domain-containing protein [Feifania hominis]MBC8535190.1 FtsQ-type POTRA domain-containing protein [Feifania hominis]
MPKRMTDGGAAAPRRPRKKRRRARRRGLKIFLLVLIPLIALTAACVFAVNYFFVIDTMTAAGSEHYTEAQILEASGLQMGDNLFKLLPWRADELITKKLPYLESVSMKLKIPSGVHFEAVDAQACLIAQTDSGYYLVSDRYKVLDKLETPEGRALPLVRANFGEEIAVGEKLPFLTQQDEKILIDIINYLYDNNKIDRVQWVDLQRHIDIRLMVDNRFEVELGDYMDLAQKLQFAQGILAELGEYDRGIIDVSDTEKAIFEPS